MVMNVNRDADDNFFSISGPTNLGVPYLEPKPVPENLAPPNPNVPQVGFETESNLDSLDGVVDYTLTELSSKAVAQRCESRCKILGQSIKYIQS